MQVMCHSEPKFVCPGCGKNFYHKAKYNFHWPGCQRKKYSCEICGHRFTKMSSVNGHKKQEHPDRMTLGESAISSQEDPNLSTKADGYALEDNANVHEEVRSSRQSSTQERNSKNNEEIVSLEDSRPSEHSLASVTDDIGTDSHMIDKDSRKLSVTTSYGSYKTQVDSERISQPLVRNTSIQQYRCSICDITFTEFPHIREHMVCWLK